MATLARWERLAFWAAFGAFVALSVTAAWLFPGGTYFDPNTQRFDALRNFHCDLTRERTLAGVENPGVAAGRASLVALACMLPTFFRALTSDERRPSVRWVVRGCGTLAGVAVALLALAPSRALGTAAHGVIVFAAAVPGIGGASVGLVRRARGTGGEPLASGRRREVFLGHAALVFGGLNAALYACDLLALAPVLAAIPPVQRIATVATLAWMAVTVGHASPRRGTPGVDGAGVDAAER